MKNFKCTTSFMLIIILNLLKLIKSIEISKSSKILLGATNTFDIDHGCHEIIIPNNFKKLVINLNSENLDSILITDSKIQICDEKYDLTKCCQKNSTFCIVNKNPTKNDFNLNYCIRSTNLYACKLDVSNSTNRILQEISANLSDETNTSNNNLENNTDSKDKPEESIITNPLPTSINKNPGKVTIETVIIKDQGCQTAEFLPEVECSTLGLQNCKNPNFCTDRCVYVECRKELENPDSRIFSMCLPYNLTESDITNRCRNHISFSDNQPNVYKKVCEKKMNDPGLNENFDSNSTHKFFKFLIFVMGVLVIFLFMASVYYRFSKKYNDGMPPFEAPWFIPNFIFPK
jgi:hypothetical protein